MKNELNIEPYYKKLIELGYEPFNYSEKHYIFSKENDIIKIARSTYNCALIDESYCIEKCAHDILREKGFPAAKINKIYKPGELIDSFSVLEEEKIFGKVFYNKGCERYVLERIIGVMESATCIKLNNFGMMNQDGNAKYSSWSEYLNDVIEKNCCSEKKEHYKHLMTKIPKEVQASFVLTDCNTANFIFVGKDIKGIIDVERPLCGDKDFLYGVIKARNPYMYGLVEDKIQPIKEKVHFYSEIYHLIFKQ